MVVQSVYDINIQLLVFTKRSDGFVGRVAGTSMERSGGAANYLCLPDNNVQLYDLNIGISDASVITAVEYESQTYGLFPDNIDNKHAVCSVCDTESRGAVLTIPARTTCPSGWTKEYHGFMMTNLDGKAHPTTYECVDASPEAMPIPSADSGGQLWFVKIDCSGAGSVGMCDNY